jgi:hypothetical protein
MMESETFDKWLEAHRLCAWGITMASDGEQVGVIAECYTCNTVEEFGVVDPIEVMMRHWIKEHDGGERNNQLARA